MPAKIRVKKVTARQLLDFYDAVLRCPTRKMQAKVLEIQYITLSKWVKTHACLQMAEELAISRRGNREDFGNYILRQLSPEARAVWEKIQRGANVNRLLNGARSTKIRQELFVHALVRNAFDLSAACKAAGVSRKKYEKWKWRDRKFLTLMREIRWHKKNFFEKSLISLVGQGNPAAVLMVNQTVNADRGYSNRVKVEHTGEVKHTHGFEMSDLRLDIDTRRKVLTAIREKKEELKAQQEQRQMLPAPGVAGVIDV